MLKSLAANSLPVLKHIDFPGIRPTVAELMQLFRLAPNLTTVSMIASTNSDELHAINLFKQSYPFITIDWVSLTTDSEQSEESQPTSSCLTLDGKIGKEGEIPTLSARTLFKARGRIQPLRYSYHLHSLSWNSIYGIFTSIYPKSTDLEVVDESLKLTNQQLEEAFNALDENSEQLYGQINLLNPILNQWIQLPALSTRDELIHYAVDHQDYELKRDKRSGYYFIKFKAAVTSCVVNYLINAGSDENDIIYGEVPVEHLEWTATLSFSQDGSLTASNAYHNLLLLDMPSRIRALTTFCRFKAMSASEDIEGETVDILNALLRIQAGVCRHRAQLFVALAGELGIDATLIRNDLHEFVRVNYNSYSTTIDLGGGEANILDLPMPSLVKPELQQSKYATSEKVKKQIFPLSPTNRFQT